MIMMKKINKEDTLIKSIDIEINKLIEEATILSEEELITDKDTYIRYGMITRRLDELTKIRGELIKHKGDYNKISWKDIAQIALIAASIITPAIMTAQMRNSEINNERIFGRSVGYKYIPKTPQPNQIKI